MLIVPVESLVSPSDAMLFPCWLLEIERGRRPAWMSLQKVQVFKEILRVFPERHCLHVPLPLHGMCQQGDGRRGQVSGSRQTWAVCTHSNCYIWTQTISSRTNYCDQTTSSKLRDEDIALESVSYPCSLSLKIPSLEP